MEYTLTPDLREQTIQIIKEMPQDATLSDFIEKLYFTYTLKKRLAQAERGEGITQAELEARVESWFT